MTRGRAKPARRRAGVACAVLWLLQACPELARAADGDTDDGSHLQSVVVTARKRPEELQAVPLSIAPWTAAELEAASVQRLSDLGQLTPNLLIGQKVQSGSSASQVYIRGIGQQDTNVAFSPAVGIYVDGVYLGRAQGSDLDLEDVERVEVLYGPQGTLFGKNTNGGAINVVTRQPDPSAATPGGQVDVRTGNFDRLDLLARLNVPLAAHTAGLSISAARLRQDGYSVRADGEHQADRNRDAARVQLLLRPLDDVEAVLRLDGTTFDERSAAYRLVQVRTASPIPTLYNTTSPYRYDDRWVTSSDFTYDGGGPNRNAGGVWGVSATVSWERPWGTLKSISAYRQLSVDSQFDPDGSPLTVLDVFNIVHQHQLSQEFQASGRAFGDRVDWVAGAYAFREDAIDDQPVHIAMELLDGAADFDPWLRVVNSNFAVYGQGTWHASDALSLSVGLRLGQDRVRAAREQFGFPDPVVQQPYSQRSAQWGSALPRASLEYRWTPRVMTYVSLAAGSKSGGFNGRASTEAEFTRFEPERVANVEAGLRSDWLDRRLRFNATLFHSAYHDFQLQVNRSVTDPTTGQPTAFSFVGNLPRARVRGGEFSLAALPLNGLELQAGLGITDARYLQVLPGAPVTTDSRFIDTPKFTASASVQYTAGLGGQGQLSGRLDYVHKSRIDFDPSNSPLVAQRPYGLLNARLTWEPVGTRTSVYAFVTNLTDTHYAVGGIDDSAGGSLGEVVKMMGAPREWGVGLRLPF
jgi:iron complex outermembrane receptor protein